MKLLIRFFFVCLLLLVLPAVAAAATGANSPHLLLPSNQIWLVAISSLVPLVTYVINHVGPWLTEPIKAIVLVVVAAVVGALDTAITTSNFGFNATTAQLIVTAVVTALVSHQILWKPSGISILLGGGTNKQPAPAGPVAP